MNTALGNENRHKGTFWGNDNILYLEKSLDYRDVCIC